MVQYIHTVTCMLCHRVPDIQDLEGEEGCGAEDQGQAGQDDGEGEERAGGRGEGPEGERELDCLQGVVRMHIALGLRGSPPPHAESQQRDPLCDVACSTEEHSIFAKHIFVWSLFA